MPLPQTLTNAAISTKEDLKHYASQPANRFPVYMAWLICDTERSPRGVVTVQFSGNFIYQ